MTPRDLYACQRLASPTRQLPPASGEPLDPDHASVQPIEESIAKAYVESNHCSYPAARFRAGVLVKLPFSVSDGPA